MHSPRSPRPTEPDHTSRRHDRGQDRRTAYIQFTQGLITDDGEVTVESTRDFLRDYMAEFYGFITRVYTALPREGA